MAKQRCGHCRKVVLLVIECPLCARQFCVYDRAPEDHACAGLDAYKRQPPPDKVEKLIARKLEYI